MSVTSFKRTAVIRPIAEKRSDRYRHHRAAVSSLREKVLGLALLSRHLREIEDKLRALQALWAELCMRLRREPGCPHTNEIYPIIERDIANAGLVI
jgi:hypothetical protein